MFDLVIKNGKVIDGTGKPAYFADLAIENGKIVAIGPDLEDGKTVIDAKGMAVTPGFIDSHSHSDENVFTYPGQQEKVEQGVTTSIGGQCGASSCPTRLETPTGTDLQGKYETVGQYLTRGEQVPQGSNLAIFVGHSQIRRAVMGMDNREPTPEELEEMKALLREGLEQGAVGISYGLIYTPGTYAKTDELIEMAKVAAEYDALAAAHIRNEADFLVEAVEEFLEVIKAAKVRAVFSHHKAMFQQNHGKVQKTLELIRKANEEGAEIYCDVYPYVASATLLAARFIPSEYRKGEATLAKMLEDRAFRDMVKAINLEKWGTGLDWVQITTCTGFPQYVGMTVDKIAKIHGKDEYETIFDLLQYSGGYCDATFFSMSEKDVETVLAFDRAMICTDAPAAAGKSAYHPRISGSFPRALGKYVRQQKVVSWEEMIRKMTSLPASVYSLKGKGVLAEGMDADICVFDPETIIDRADFTDCYARAEGMAYVLVGGQVVAENAVYNGKTPGKVLRVKHTPKKQ